MPVRLAKPIDLLFDEVRGFDLVLTSDAPLALALNRRLTEPRLGHFAVTPRNYARQGLELPDKRALFHQVVSRTELGWKRAARTLDLVLRSWGETGEREQLLGYARFDRAASREICQVLAEIPSTHRARERVRIPSELDVAVIGESQLSALDRRVLPERYTVVDPFVPGEHFDPPPFSVLPSVTDILSVLEAHITPENADEVGIVLHPGSPMRSMVESMLEAREIPYRSEESLTQDSRLRALLHLLRLGLSNHRLRVRDVRGVMRELGVHLPAHADDKLLARVDAESVDALSGFWATAQDGRLCDALAAFEELAERDEPELRELLDELKVLEAPVARSVLDNLEYYLDTFDIQTDRSQQGVLLASALSNAYVDASTVFYLGMDAAWSQEVDAYPWIDATRRELENRTRFELLIQNGQLPVYLVQDTRLGDPVTPCFHLHELLDTEFERFTDLGHTRYIAPDHPLGDGFSTSPLDGFEPSDPIETISASKLNLLAYCPRDYLFDVLVRTPEKDYFERGNLFHEFAEVHATHPDAFDPEDDRQVASLVDRMIGEMAPFTEDEDHAALRTELRVGLVNLARWLDANPCERVQLAGYARTRETNRFATWLGVDIDESFTELWFENEAKGIHGKVDLVRTRTHVVDHKSTKRQESEGRIAENATPGAARKRPDFQPAVYLTHHRSVTELTDPVRFTLLHFLSRIEDHLKGEDELEDLERTVRYVPQRFEAWVSSQDAFERVQDSNERERVFSRLGHEAWARFFEGRELPSFASRETVLASDLPEAFIALGKAEIGDYAYVEKCFTMALKKLADARNGVFFAEDLDAFEAFVQEQLDALNTYRAARFPVGNADLDETRHPDLILRRL